MRFFLLGDMGTGDKYQKQVGKALSKEIQGYGKDTFVCGLGDNIYEMGVKSVFDTKFQTHFEKPYQMIPDSVRFYMCLGNHDYEQKNIRHQIDYTNHSKKWFLPETYYQFRKQDKNCIVDFFVLDTNLEYNTPEYNKQQLKEMKQWIKDSDADWKIVYGHHTWRSVAGHGNAEPELESFLQDLFKSSPFDMYMCGHDHTKQLFDTNIQKKPLVMVVCGTGSKPYPVNLSDNLCESEGLQFSSHNLGFGLCDISKKKLVVEFYTENNQFEFRYEINR